MGICRAVSRKQMIHCCAQIIDISSAVSLTASAKLFRRGITSGAETCSITFAVFFVFACGAEVNQRDIAVGLEHYICGLHVAIDNRRCS